MSEEIKAQLIFDESSQLGAFRLHMMHRYRIWMMLRTFLSVTLLFAGVILLIARGAEPMAILMLMVGTFALLRPMIWKIMHSRNLRRLPGYGQKVIYTFSPEGLAINGEDRNASIKWEDIFEIVSSKKGILLYHAKKSYTWVPSDAFDSVEDFQQVQDWARGFS